MARTGNGTRVTGGMVLAAASLWALVAMGGCESTPEPTPEPTMATVTYPACSDLSSPPCVEQDADGYWLVSTGMSDMGPLRTPAVLVETRPADATGIVWITVTVTSVPGVGAEDDPSWDCRTMGNRTCGGQLLTRDMVESLFINQSDTRDWWACRVYPGDAPMIICPDGYTVEA